MVVYISMAFGNPYGDPWSADEVVEAVGLIADMDIRSISLADTVGLATPEQIAELLGAVIGKFDYLEIGAHLHSRRDQAVARVLAAYDAGCRRFDSAIGGLGGCPFAQDALVGNHSDGTGAGGARATRGRLADPQAARFGDGDERRHRRPLFGQIAKADSRR